MRRVSWIYRQAHTVNGRNNIPPFIGNLNRLVGITFSPAQVSDLNSPTRSCMIRNSLRLHNWRCEENLNIYYLSELESENVQTSIRLNDMASVTKKYSYTDFYRRIAHPSMLLTVNAWPIWVIRFIVVQINQLFVWISSPFVDDIACPIPVHVHHMFIYHEWLL